MVGMTSSGRWLSSMAQFDGSVRDVGILTAIGIYIKMAREA